jgi:hypothetical protein
MWLLFNRVPPALAMAAPALPLLAGSLLAAFAPARRAEDRVYQLPETALTPGPR